MPDLTRRALLKSIPACGLAAIMPASAVALAAHDPLIDLIGNYHATMKDFCDNAPDDDEGSDAYAEATYSPVLRAIENWKHPAVTQKGAVEALRFALQESTDFEGSRTVRPLLAAALAYFEQEGGAA